MTTRVGVEFDGNARGAVTAGAQTQAALRRVKAETGGAEREARQFSRASRAADADLGKLTRGALAGSGAFHGFARSIAFASAGFLTGAGLSAALRGAIGELSESVRVAAQSAQAIRTTGGAAGVTARQIDVLANAILRKTGVDDEATKSAANLLLTFTEVRNEVGRGNDIFTRATRAIVDMSAVQGDLQGNTMQLGKALNDPITGMTTLRRVGIQFTAQTRAQIKALVEHNRILDAQKLILREVEREFGGQAAAQEKAKGGVDVLRESVRNLSAELLRGLLPAFRDQITSAQHWVDELANNKEAQERFRDTVLEVAGAVKDVAGVTRDAVGAVGGLKNALEILLALKVTSVLKGWTGGLAELIGTSSGGAVGSGLAGAAARSGALLTRLIELTAKPWVIALSIPELPALADALKVLRGGDPFAAPGSTDTSHPYGSALSAAAQRGSDKVRKPLYAPDKDTKAGLAAIRLAKLYGYPEPYSVIEAFWDGKLSADRFDEFAARLAKIYPAIFKDVVVPSAGATDTLEGGGIQLPTSIKATHQTAGLAGFPAVDIMAKPGTKIRAPEDGMITRISGNEPTAPPPQGQGGPWGLSIYFVGAKTGNTYYMTHLMRVAQPGSYKKGDVIGMIGDYPGSPADHVHFAIHRGDAAEAHAASTLINPADYLARGASTRPPRSNQAPPPPKVDLTKMPAGLRLQVAEAEGANQTQREIQLLGQWEKLLGQRKQKAKSLTVKADIQEEIDSVLGRIAGLRKTPDALTKMPDRLRLLIAEAEGHGQTGREIKLLGQWEKLLEKRKAAAKTLAKKADIQEEIDSVIGRIAGLRKTPGGAGVGVVTSLRDTIAAALRDAKTELEGAPFAGLAQLAATQLEKLRDHLKVKMSAKDLAETRSGIKRWGDVLKDAVAAQARRAADAAAQIAEDLARVRSRAWEHNLTQITRAIDAASSAQVDAFGRTTDAHLRDMQRGFQASMDAFGRTTDDHVREMQRGFQQSMDEFERTTQAGLEALAAPEETPEERALRLFQEQRTGAAWEQRKRDLKDQIAKTQQELAGIGGGGTGAGVVIDVSLGTTGASAATEGMTPEEIAAKRDDLNKQLLDLQREWDDLMLDEQDKTLSEAARASREAAAKQAEAAQRAYQRERDQQRQALELREADLEQAYQLERDQQRQALELAEADREQAYQLERDAQLAHLQAMLDDQRTGLNDQLEDLRIQLERRLITWADYKRRLGELGIATEGLTDPTTTFAPSTPIEERRGTIVEGHAVYGFQHGGKLPGRYIGRPDTLMYRGTPGETVVDRRLTRALEDEFLNGRGGSGGVTLVVTGNTLLGSDLEMAKKLAALLQGTPGPVVYRAPR